MRPAYLALFDSGELEERVERLEELQKECRLCPRRCGAKRHAGEAGECGATDRLVVSSAFPHLGEEPELVGLFGSGTIFLTHCNLKCVFCQNDDISHHGIGQPSSVEDVAEHMIHLQNRGCHNINFVTPTHYTPQIVSAIARAVGMGLQLPVVWNCGGYESSEAIKLLDAVVDIYMPDVKFFNAASAQQYCNAPDYPDVVKTILKEMHRQVGDLTTDMRGIAQRGLLVRHLVMPNGVADTRAVVRFIAEEISTDTYVNIMDQYRPLHNAGMHEKIDRTITVAEYREAIADARECGLHRGFR